MLSFDNTLCAAQISARPKSSFPFYEKLYTFVSSRVSGYTSGFNSKCASTSYPKQKRSVLFSPQLDLLSVGLFSVICNKTEKKKVKETYQRKHILKKNLKKGLSLTR